MPQELIWLNGEVGPLADARLSVEDRGFQFADGVYEVVRLYGGKPFTLSEHLERTWSQALLAVSAVEDEATRWVHRVAGVVGWGPEDVRRHAGEWTVRLAGQRQELERFVDEGVRRALSRFQLPKRETIQDIDRRLGALSRRVDALRRGSV